MANPKIKCGVAGVGSLGRHHARIYTALPHAELTGIFEPSDAREVRAAAGASPRPLSLSAGR